MSRIALLSFVLLAQTAAQAAPLCASIWAQNRTSQNIRLDLGDPKPSYQNTFITGKAHGANEGWKQVDVGGQKIWITEATLTELGPSHLYDRLSPEQRQHFQSGNRYTIASRGLYPPFLKDTVDNYLYLNLTDIKLNKDITLTDTKTGREVLQVQGNEHPEPKTAEDFRRWDKDDREMIFDGLGYNSSKDFLTYKNLSVGEVNLTTLKTATPESKIAQQVEKDFQDKYVSSYEVEADNGYVTIGEPQVTVSYVRHADGTILGGLFTVNQQGGMFRRHKSNAPSHFDDIASARKAGVDVEADVSWAANGLFEIQKDGQIEWMSGNDYMEWRGH